VARALLVHPRHLPYPVIAALADRWPCRRPRRWPCRRPRVAPP